MNLLELRTEVEARGFDEVGSARINRWINRAYNRICDRQAWPFLEATTTGAAPLTISDVRAVLSVIDTDNDNVLEPEDFRTIREADPTLAVTGNPDYWYLNGSALSVYPAWTGNLSVHYLKVPATLTADSDTPVLPTRYHPLLVDFAVCEAYKDSDNLEAWQILRGDVEEQVQEMTNALFANAYDFASAIHPAGGSSDW